MSDKKLQDMTEAELRDYKVPFPSDQAELIAILEAVTKRQHDYGTCVYAMSIAATAAFNYVARVLGTTGFQSGCADLDIVRRTRLMECPFVLLKAEDLLYPQYDLRQKLEECIEAWGPWLKEQAAERLKSDRPAAPSVLAHWEGLAES